jgi:hypothetical protein
MGVRYSIRNWKERFEVAQATKVKSWSWVALPNKHDGLGFRRIMSLSNGMVVYAAWCLMVQIASKCPVRGVLADENGPLDANDLSLKTGAPKTSFEQALSALSDKKIGWILVEHYEDASSTPSLHNKTEQDITEQDNIAADAAAPVDPNLRAWLDWWNCLARERLVLAGIDAETPSKAVVRAWSRVAKDGGLRALLADRAAVRREIELSSFVRTSGWFTLPKLFGGTNKSGELIAERLMQGAFRDAKPNGRESNDPRGNISRLNSFLDGLEDDDGEGK